MVIWSTNTPSCRQRRAVADGKWTSYTHSFNEVWMGPNFTLGKKKFFSSSRFRIHFPNCWDFSSPIRILPPLKCGRASTQPGISIQSMTTFRRSKPKVSQNTPREKFQIPSPFQKATHKIWISYLYFSSWTLPRLPRQVDVNSSEMWILPAREKKFESSSSSRRLGTTTTTVWCAHEGTLLSPGNKKRRKIK